MSATSEARAAQLIAKLEAAGYERYDRGDAVLLHERKFKVTRFSVVDTVIGITAQESVTEDSFMAHDANTVEGARSLKSAWPLGMGGSIEQFPIVFADVADNGALEAAAAQSPKRWGIMSAHAVVHAATGEATMFEGRALWGAAYIAALRVKLKEILA